MLVTGASRGLGAEIALAFAAEGAWVGLGCRVRRAEAKAVLHELRTKGGEGEVLLFDLRDRAATQAAVDRVEAGRGGIDIVVANAALAGESPFAIANAEAWDEIIQVNLMGTANTLRAVTRGMLTRGHGVVVVIGSVASLRAAPGQSAYTAAKAGLMALVRAVGTELAPKGVRVNAVVPGLIDAGMTHRTPNAVVQKWKQATPAQRLGTPADVSNAVLFLASSDSGFVVGQSLVVDGGLSL